MLSLAQHTDEAAEHEAFAWPEADVEASRSDERFIKLVGLAEIIMGALLILYAPVLKEKLPQWFTSTMLEVVQHLGGGVIAAGALTATVEVISKRRTRKEIQKLNRATLDGILSALVPKAVFPEIRRQIISRPFLRFGYECHVAMTWNDAAKQQLLIRTNISYTLQNTSIEPRDYELLVRERWDRPNVAKPTLHTLSVYRERNDEFDGKNLAESQEEEGQSCVVRKTIRLYSGQTAQISSAVSRLMPGQDSHAVHFSHATKGATISVYHPEDLCVQIEIFHPAGTQLLQTSKDANYKRWEFSPGFLPFQGFELIWHLAEGERTEPAAGTRPAREKVLMPQEITHQRAPAARSSPSQNPVSSEGTQAGPGA